MIKKIAKEIIKTVKAHNAILSLIKQMKIKDKIVIWGHSIGGYIAMSFVGLYPDICT